MNSFLTNLKNIFRSSGKTSPNGGTDSEAVSVPVTSRKGEHKQDTTGRLRGVEAPDGKEFAVHDGPTVATVGGLAEALHQAPEATFHHHITSEKNDFANWIRDVFEDDVAASILESARNPSEVVDVLNSLSA